MPWEDNLGNEFETYEEYCQSPYIDYDEKCILLWQGFRKPQNDDERELKEELEEFERQGKSWEVYSD